MKMIKSNQLEGIEKHFEKLIGKTEASVGCRQSIGDIEGDIMTELLALGKLLLAERVSNEEAHLESIGYEVVGEKNQEASRTL